MQSPRWSGTEHSQEMPESGHCMKSFKGFAEPWRGWTTLIASGALTPGLLSSLALAAGFATTLSLAPAQAAPIQTSTQLAAADASAPVVSILRPTHADQLRGTEQIQISVKAGRYPARSLEMYVDDRMATPGAVALDSSMLPVAVFNWDTRVFADGPHRLSVTITDSQGFKSTANVQVYINNRGEEDIIPPTLRWLNVHHGDPIRGEFPVQVEATDNFGVKWVIISLNRAISPAIKPPLRAVMVNKPPYILRLRPDLPADTYVLTATAWDAKDNRGDAPPIEILYQPNINFTQGPVIASIPTTGNVIPTPPVPGPSGGVDTAPQVKPEKLVVVLPPVPASVPQTPKFDPLAPRLSMSGRDAIAGDNGAIPPNASDVIARAGLGNREPVRIALLDPSTPRSETRERPATPVAPPTPPVLTPARGGHSELNAPIGTHNSVLDHPQRVASANKPNLLTQPAGETKSMPGAGAMTRGAGAAEMAAPAIPTTPSAFRAPRIAKLNPVQPPAQLRTPLVAVAPPTVSTPQMAHTSLANTTIASVTEVRPRSAATAATTLASAPSALVRRAEPVISAPQLTSGKTASSSISRSFPEMKPRPAHGPSLAVLPEGAAQYPQLPSPLLSSMTTPGSVISTVPAPAIRNAHSGVLPVLPPTLPKLVPPTSTAPQLAMNPAMPAKNARPNPLASITVAPQAEWGTQAEVMPVSHTVRRDETLSSIARRYQMPVSVLAAANNLKETATIRTGAQLALPRALRVTYAGQPVKTDASSFMMGSVGVTPFRFLFEKQGGKLEWDAKTHRVTARGAGSNVSVTVGSRTAVVNQKEVLMDLAAFLMSGRTMVPLRFFEQALQARVDWDPATGRIFVAMSNPAAV